MKYRILGIVLLFAVVMSCKKEEEDIIPSTPAPDSGQVIFDLSEVPYPKLSDYRFFLGDQYDMSPNERVLPYDVITPLFADYAKKMKFIWMPEGSSAEYLSDHAILDFPEGTVMIKSFFYDNVQPEGNRQFLETRLIYRKENEWHFADYIWNDEQTEAYFNLDGSYVPIDWIDEEGTARSVDFRIPSESECLTCHKSNDKPIPIGPKPQNLNMNYSYSDGSMNQLERWVQAGYLQPNYPSNIETVADWSDPTVPLFDRVRAYVDMNCAHCHQENSHCSYRPMRFALSESEDLTNMGVCVEPAEEINSALQYVVAAGNIERSVMHYRMNTTDEVYRMPLLGRSLVHEEAIELFTEWIESLDPPCQ